MRKVMNKEHYFELFNEYSHNIPIIYSSLEGQYDGQLYADDLKNPQIAVLFTPFAFHYVVGNTEIDNVVDILDDIVFKQYLTKTNQKEAIVFGSNSKWDNILDEVFERYNGITDDRMVFHLNRVKFKAQLEGRRSN